jgi:mono/diheme cytochrome c family protein
MTRVRAAAFALLLAAVAVLPVETHDFNSTITWNREISRLFLDRCVTCHREGGSSFPLTTWQDAQPRAVAIKDAVLSRRMPPWGAVKGFGEFRNDRGLTQEQVELVSGWIEGGAPRGNNRRMLPEMPAKFEPPPGAPARLPRGSVVVSRDMTLDRDLVVDGLVPDGVRRGMSMQVTAVTPNGAIEPLVWLYEYDPKFRHAFLFRTPVLLPRGTIIRGVRAPARITLLPVGSGGS